MKTKFCLIIVIVSLGIVTNNIYAQSVNLRPYFTFGGLLTPPTAEELGYEIIGGTVDPNEYLEMDAANAIIGTQLLIKLGKESPYKLGLDIGAGKLFSSTYSSDASAAHKDKESAVKLIITGEYNISPRFYIQAGVGPNIISWSWHYEFHGTFTEDVTKDESGGDVSPEIMAGIGYNLVNKNNFALPVIVRTDCIFRDGVYLQLNVGLGLNFAF